LPDTGEIGKPLGIGCNGECLPRYFGARGGVNQRTTRDFDGSHLALPFEVGVPNVFEGRHRVPSGQGL
jgi:hypothetical protein